MQGIIKNSFIYMHHAFTLSMWTFDRSDGALDTMAMHPFTTNEMKPQSVTLRLIFVNLVTTVRLGCTTAEEGENSLHGHLNICLSEIISSSQYRMLITHHRFSSCDSELINVLIEVFTVSLSHEGFLSNQKPPKRTSVYNYKPLFFNHIISVPLSHNHSVFVRVRVVLK